MLAVKKHLHACHWQLTPAPPILLLPCSCCCPGALLRRVLCPGPSPGRGQHRGLCLRTGITVSWQLWPPPAQAAAPMSSCRRSCAAIVGTPWRTTCSCVCLLFLLIISQSNFSVDFRQPMWLKPAKPGARGWRSVWPDNTHVVSRNLFAEQGAGLADLKINKRNQRNQYYRSACSNSCTLRTCNGKQPQFRGLGIYSWRLARTLSPLVHSNLAQPKVA